MKALKVIKAPVPGGCARLMMVLVLTTFFVSLLSLNSYADNAKDLIDAAEKGDTARVNALLNKGADVNAKDKDGWTALMYVSNSRFSGSTGIIKALLDKGADVNAKNKYGLTALMYASNEGLDKVVEMLIAKGADVNVKDKNVGTALLFASEEGHTGIVQLLKKAGAKK